MYLFPGNSLVRLPCFFVFFLQVYVKGEMVGGLDILKEMKNDGPLAPQLGIAAKVDLRFCFFHALLGQALSRAVRLVLCYCALE